LNEFLITFFFAVIFIAGFYGFYKLLLYLLAHSGRKAMEEINATLARATPASAKVLSQGEPSMMWRKPRMSAVYSVLLLEVHPPAGEPYEASTIWEVNRTALPEIQPGRTVGIRIDSDKRSTIYPDVNWAWFNWP
jgi:hypothetical protein